MRATDYTVLSPAIALMNHNKHFNAKLGCEVDKDVTTVIAVRDIEEGEEVTIEYSSDIDILKGHWGIIQD